MKSIGQQLQAKVKSDSAATLYSHFEPWDVEERSDEVMAQAIKDDIDLYRNDYVKTNNIAPHPFQSGFLLSTQKTRASVAGSRTGKALPLDAKVYTPFGFKLMGDMCVGDKVLTPCGSHALVKSVHPQGVRNVYKLTFDDGSTCESDGEHLWKYLSAKRRSKERWSHGKIEPNPMYEKWELGTLQSIIERFGEGYIKPGKRPVIPIIEPRVDFSNNSKLEIPPYFMGAMLGDGGFTQKNTSFTNHINDYEIVERMIEEGADVFKRSSKFSYGVRGILPELKRLGLWKLKSDKKFIPEEYKYRSWSDRLNILRGLMDTDGSIDSRHCIEFSSKSKVLAEDVAWLVASLGGKAKVSSRKTGYKKDGVYVDCGVGYRVRINLFRHNPFFLKRKADLCKSMRTIEGRLLCRIDRIEDKETQCITLSSDDGLFMTDNMIVTHNSYPIFIEIGCMCSGEFPISLQYNKGVDTGVKRTKTFLNVQRWGRRDLETGEVIDYNTAYPDDGTWDCGTIIGAGKYPQEKVIPESLDGLKEDRTIWVGTTATALAESWWPKLTEDGARVLPEKFIDKTKGNNGANSSTSVVYLKNDIRLSIISYESGHRKFEAITAWACFFDEEPPDRRCVSAAMSHCKFFSLTMTPLLGMSYTKDLIFKKQHPSKVVFQANTYDSPYVSEEEIDEWRSDFPEDEIGARVWGDHTAEAKTPYYAKKKIKGWLNQFFEMEHGFTAIFEPSKKYFGLYKRPETNLPGLMDVTISLVPAEYDDDDPKKPKSVWRIYEDRKDDAAYFITADCANGSDLPEDVGDLETAMVLRAPMPELDEMRPVIVAELITTEKPDRFAMEVGMALNYYNFALLCGEAASRGAANGMFYSEMKTYKYWYTRFITNQRSKKHLEKKGFDTNVATRKPLFDEVEAWFSQFEEDEYPDIPSEALLIMASECIRTIKNGKVRPDHPRNRNNDLLVCFGMALWIFKTFPEQIKCRREKKKVEIDPGNRRVVMRLLQAAGGSQQEGDKYFPQHKGRRR